MSNNKDLNLDEIEELQVIVTRPILVSGQIWEPRIYDNPPKVLINCAIENKDNTDSVIFFGMYGDKFNPFSTVEMVDLRGSEDDGDDNEGTVPPTNPEDVIPPSNFEDDDEDDEESKGFLTNDEFVALSKQEQYDYVESIKDTPEDLTEEESEEYEAQLFEVLKGYSEVATGKKAIELIDEALSEYEA